MALVKAPSLTNKYNTEKLGGTALISAEEGSVELIKKPLQLDADTLSTISPTNPSSYDTIASEIASYIERVNPKEIWIEWNGMLGFHQLETLLYSEN